MLNDWIPPFMEFPTRKTSFHDQKLICFEEISLSNLAVQLKISFSKTRNCSSKVICKFKLNYENVIDEYDCENV